MHLLFVVLNLVIESRNVKWAQSSAWVVAWSLIPLLVPLDFVQIYIEQIVYNYLIWGSTQFKDSTSNACLKFQAHYSYMHSHPLWGAATGTHFEAHLLIVVLVQVLLGIGPDGHIASLFPNSPQLAETRQWVVPISKSPKPPPRRISLTLPCINSAVHVSFQNSWQGQRSVTP